MANTIVEDIVDRAGTPTPQQDVEPLTKHLRRRLLREPLLHFLLIGVVLFVASHFIDRGRGSAEPSKQIQLTVDDLRQVDVYFQSQWRRPPTPEELGRLMESKVQEEVLYREALALGLDKDDSIVKRRMAQKMRFLAEDVAAARQPTAAELHGWYEKYSDAFALPGRVSFRCGIGLPAVRV